LRKFKEISFGVEWEMSISSTWLIGSKFVRLWLMVVWVFAICFFSTKLSWASGYGGMLMKLILCGVEWWIVSMVVKGGAGAQIKLEIHTG
jgi:hypothetical protein